MQCGVVPTIDSVLPLVDAAVVVVIVVVVVVIVVVVAVVVEVLLLGPPGTLPASGTAQMCFEGCRVQSLLEQESEERGE